MRRLSLRASALAVLSFLAGTNARGQSASPPKYPNVTIAGSELRTLKSTSTGRDYDIDILFPASYAQNSDKRYPVLYVLDGQWDFKLLASIQGGLFYDKVAPEMLVVGVTYSGVNPNYDVLRALDLTTVAVASSPGSGGAPKFLSFLERELLPFIETNYRADPAHRVLLGNSLGGLFTLYAMMTKPGLFQGFVASSPAVTSGDRDAFTQEKKYAATHKILPGRLFIAVGSDEPLAQPVKEFIDVLRSRNYSGLEMETRVVDGEKHSGNKPETYNRGLRYVFGGKP